MVGGNEGRQLEGRIPESIAVSTLVAEGERFSPRTMMFLEEGSFSKIYTELLLAELKLYLLSIERPIDFFLRARRRVPSRAERCDYDHRRAPS